SSTNSDPTVITLTTHSCKTSSEIQADFVSGKARAERSPTTRHMGVIFVQHPLAVFAAAAAIPTGLTPLLQPAYTSTASADLAPRTVCRGQAAPTAPAVVQVRAMRCLINWAR